MSMNEAIGDEVAEPVDGSHVLNKENEFSLKPRSSDMLQPHEMVTPGVGCYHENSKNPYSDTVDANDLDRIGSSEHASASPHCMDDAGVMVEELTLKNYDGEKLTVVGTSNNREKMQSTIGRWQHLYQIAGGSGIGNPHGHNVSKGKGQETSSAWDEDGNNLFSGLLDESQRLQKHNHNAVMDSFLSNDDKGPPGDKLYSSGGIRAKILSKSGFSEYFIKNTLRGKGVIHRSQDITGYGTAAGDHSTLTPGISDKGVLHKTDDYRESGTESGRQDHPSSGTAGLANSVAPLGLTERPASPVSQSVFETCISLSSNCVGDGTNLREWLERGRYKANKIESMRIFRQVLHIVDSLHSRGVVLQDLRPSFFKLSRSHQVMYLGSSVHAGVAENVSDQDIREINHSLNEKRPMRQSMLPLDNQSVKKRKLVENMNFMRRWPQFPSRSGIRSASANVA